LPPIFVCTATATGAATCHLVLAAGGLADDHPTRTALRTIENGALAVELVLSAVNERRLGPLREALETGRAGLLFKLAKGTVLSGLALRLARRPLAPQLDRVASILYLAAGLSFRFAWVAAGRNSADDDAAVARAARSGLGAAGGETHAPATGYPVGGTAESPDRTTFS